MSLGFINPDSEPSRALTVRFDADSYNTVVQYAKENDIDDFAAALRAMLARINRMGTEQFYQSSKVNTQQLRQTHSSKSPQIGVHHGDIFISDDKKGKKA